MNAQMRLARFFSIGCRVAQWLCLLVMFASATVFMLAWAYLDPGSAPLGVAVAGFVWCGIGLLFAFVFERSRTTAATLRFMLTRMAAILVLSAAAAYLLGLLWLEPGRDSLDALLERASCEKYGGTIEKGWERNCTRPE